MQHGRNRIREITLRRRLLLPVEQIVRELNQFLRRWAGYFRYGNSTRQLDMMRIYAVDRLARFVAKRHQRSWRYGWKVVAFESPDCLGLISLHGIVVAPRPNRPSRGKPNADVNGVGEPCAREPHARFDGGREETTPVGLPQPHGAGASRLPDHADGPKSRVVTGVLGLCAACARVPTRRGAAGGRPGVLRRAGAR